MQKYQDTQNTKNTKKHKINAKKLKPGLVTSYDIWPGNEDSLFLFRHFKNKNMSLTYLFTASPTYLQPQDPHGAN